MGVTVVIAEEKCFVYFEFMTLENSLIATLLSLGHLLADIFIITSEIALEFRVVTSVEKS